MRRALGIGVSGLAVAATVALSAGCGSDDKSGPAAPPPTPAATATTTTTPTPTVTATATAPPAETVTQTVTAVPPPVQVPVPPPPVQPPAQPTTAAPATVVQAYYDAVNAQNYQRAWALGGRNLAGSYGEFAARFAGTAYDRLTVVSVQGDVVGIQLDALQTDGSHRYFAGTYTVRGGEIAAASVRQTGTSGATGPTPGVYYSNCDDARAHTRTPIFIGEPGYGEHLDADHDGRACEPPPGPS